MVTFFILLRLLYHGAPGLVDVCLANSEAVRPGLVERYRQEHAVPLVVDRERFASLGLELIERPVAAQTGNYARHSSSRLAEEIMDVYRQRTVRMFRGERRYIVEE